MFLALLATMTARAGINQWTNGPPGGVTYSIAVDLEDPGRLYPATGFTQVLALDPQNAHTLCAGGYSGLFAITLLPRGSASNRGKI